MKVNILGLCFLCFFSCFEVIGQYDFVVKALNIHSEITSIPLEGSFEKSIELQNGKEIEVFIFSDSPYDLCYYPMQSGIDCGYFIIDTQLIYVNDKYPYNLGCDLDYSSFELFELKIRKKQYLILTSVSYGSGTTTRYVYCNLFDITNLEKIQFFPLWSMYGSDRCLGDFNEDGIVDFLEIRYDKAAKDNDVFRLTFSTLEGDAFKRDEDKYIVFRREYQKDDLPKIITLEEKW